MTPFWAEYDRLLAPYEKKDKPKKGEAETADIRPRVLVDLRSVTAAEDIIRDGEIVGTAIFFGRQDYVQVKCPSGAVFGALRGMSACQNSPTG